MFSESARLSYSGLIGKSIFASVELPCCVYYTMQLFRNPPPSPLLLDDRVLLMLNEDALSGAPKYTLIRPRTSTQLH